MSEEEYADNPRKKVKIVLPRNGSRQRRENRKSTVDATPEGRKSKRSNEECRRPALPRAFDQAIAVYGTIADKPADEYLANRLQHIGFLRLGDAERR